VCSPFSLLEKVVEDIAVIPDLVWMRAYVSRLHLLYMYIVKKSESESRSFVSDSLDPIDCSLPGSSLGENTGVDSLSLFRGILPTQGLNLPSESAGKPKNTGLGSLSLLQGIFPTEELNQDLLHCRQIFF